MNPLKQTIHAGLLCAALSSFCLTGSAATLLDDGWQNFMAVTGPYDGDKLFAN